jgi:hypothetical protein
LQNLQQNVFFKDQQAMKDKATILSLETQLNSLKSYNVQLKALATSKKPEISEETKLELKKVENLYRFFF